jgi:hypothetical protein
MRERKEDAPLTDDHILTQLTRQLLLKFRSKRSSARDDKPQSGEVVLPRFGVLDEHQRDRRDKEQNRRSVLLDSGAARAEFELGEDDDGVGVHDGPHETFDETVDVCKR